MTDSETLLRNSKERMRRFVDANDLNAPDIIVANEALILLKRLDQVNGNGRKSWRTVPAYKRFWTWLVFLPPFRKTTMKRMEKM